MSAAVAEQHSPLHDIPLTPVTTLVLLRWDATAPGPKPVRVFTSQCRLGRVARRFTDHGQFPGADVVEWLVLYGMVDVNGLDCPDVAENFLLRFVTKDQGWWLLRQGHSYGVDEEVTFWLAEELDLYGDHNPDPRPVITVKLPD